jgi:hypothetical protein
MARMTRRRRENRVLYIADTQDLLPYDCERNGQSSPLAWGKFRTPAPLASKLGGPARSRHELYSMRRSAIKGRRDGFAILGVYDELLVFYGFSRRAAMRGWLVNHLYEPATPAQIAGVIFCHDPGLVRRALAALTAEGLLVWVKLPNLAAADLADVTTYPQGLDRPEADDPDDSHADDGPQGQKAAAQGEAGTDKTPPQDDKAAPGKPPPEPVGNRMATGTCPVDVTRETGRPETARQPDAQTPHPASAAPPPCSADGYGRPAQRLQTASAAPQPDGQTADEAQALPVPDGTQPIQQQHTGDGTQGDRRQDKGTTGNVASHDGNGADAAADEPTEADPRQRAKAALARAGQVDMSHHAELFARQVLDVLYPDRKALVEQGRRCEPPQGPDEFQRREGACVARCFEKALPMVDSVGAMRMIQAATKMAEGTFRKKVKRTRGRLWVYEFNGYTAKLRAGASGPP